MKSNIKWGVPVTRTKKVEKYADKAVLTLEPLGEKGTSRKFSLNSTAASVLGLVLGTDSVSLAFFEDKIFITKADDVMEHFGKREKYDI